MESHNIKIMQNRAIICQQIFNIRLGPGLAKNLTVPCAGFRGTGEVQISYTYYGSSLPQFSTGQTGTIPNPPEQGGASQSICNNGIIEVDEQCDDGNTNIGDGCDDFCQIETGYTCTQQPSQCTPVICGNGGSCESNNDCDSLSEICSQSTCVESEEECDDGNLINGDGCSNVCEITVECSDSIDNDSDKKIDLADLSCNGDPNGTSESGGGNREA